MKKTKWGEIKVGDLVLVKDYKVDFVTPSVAFFGLIIDVSDEIPSSKHNTSWRKYTFACGRKCFHEKRDSDGFDVIALAQSAPTSPDVLEYAMKLSE